MNASSDLDYDFDQFFFMNDDETKQVSEKATTSPVLYPQVADSRASPSQTPARFNKNNCDLKMLFDEGKNEFNISPMVSDKSFPLVAPFINRTVSKPPKNIKISTKVNISKNNSTVYNSYTGQLTPIIPATSYSGNENFPSYESLFYFEFPQNLNYLEVSTKNLPSLKEESNSELTLIDHSAIEENH
ncbi:hypothetical protein HK096_006062, partial [Nowakowskiella sp. JEL0078]